MDPVSMLSLVCNICQLCEYGAEALIKAKDIYDSETGMTAEHEKLQSSMSSLDERSELLQKSGDSSSTDDNKALRDLVTESRAISREILGLLAKIRGKNRPKLHVLSRSP
ncbi:hypothetical protein WAI453_013681 [Rhynchosporium graminicola]|uniref:Fungal N-terminal domain-containing protein n=1 Tax=Rhynchosporium graminicola TaxID=2792576 RepID=A0A1E1LA62_9HELO|nr:uncharacterized protein RCO7_07359 [Rhynchosporium commune]